MLVAKLFSLVILIVFVAGSEKKEYPPGSPKGPNYCKSKTEFPCRKPKVNNQHIFCDCHKYKCHNFFPKNMTQWRAFCLKWTNHFRNVVATGEEKEMLGANKPFPQAADMNAMSYNYVMEDGARCHAKKCVDPLESDSCHQTAVYNELGGGGQNAMKGTKPTLECRWITGPVEGCDTNTMDKYEVLAYCAIRKWYEEFKDLTNASILDTAYYDDPVKPADYKKTGHLTALIWAKSTEMGCGSTKDKKEERFYFTCNYWVQGNLQHHSVYTVGPKTSKCAADRPAGQVPEFKGLCGPAVLPPAPPDDFFISSAPKISPVIVSQNIGFSLLFHIVIYVLIN